MSLPSETLENTAQTFGVVGTAPLAEVSAVIGERLSLVAFSQLSGNLAGYPFVKVVVDRADRESPVIHFIHHSRYQFHSDYIAERLLGLRAAEIDNRIDEFNQSVYLAPDRRFYLGVLSLHSPSEAGSLQKSERFFTLETVEIDSMDAEMVKFFYGYVRANLDPSVELYFKPANHLQESIAASIDSSELPRVFTHDLFASSRFIALNPGLARGRLRAFRSVEEYKLSLPTIEWYDIIAMQRVPDDIPRVAGLINSHHTTPLSHTNVLASGWQIPNSIQLGIFDRIETEKLNGQWVSYAVDPDAKEISLTRIEKPAEISQRPAWSVHRIKLEEPETANTPILGLDELRMSDRYKYGTKAANLGELRHVLNEGSNRLLGFYKIPRPPRPNLLAHVAKLLGVPEGSDSVTFSRAATQYLRATIQVPRGIAIPFAVQREFLESSPRIQQSIGKLKMALELEAREIDALCLNLQAMIRATRLPEKLSRYIDAQVADHLAGVSSFVVRSSSNAEDLRNFSAAGIYESINHVTTADTIFESIKEVWASLISPRSVRLRHEVGISLDDSYMGVIVQEEVKGDGSGQMGGVMVTTNPMNREDFRNVYVNVSTHSVVDVVHGAENPYQYLFNTVEGAGRTLSFGAAREDLSVAQKTQLQRLALAGRLLQSHFSPDYTFSDPIDVEWLASSQGIYVLQLRPYSQ